MAKREVRLYYAPGSFYSQMVLVALKEKEVCYEGVFVDITRGQQNEAWFMRINPSGLVPTLQDGEKVIKESATIVDYIDKEFPTDSKLVPDMSTELGKEVSKWRKILGDVKAYVITYGTLCYPELSVSGLKIPKSFRKTKTEIMAANQLTGAKMEQLADLHPDLREAYMAKAAAAAKKTSDLDREKVNAAMAELEKVLDQVEAQLKKVEADPSKELWFCGQQFTAADISLCVLMTRLDLLGLGEKFHGGPDNKRPTLHAYWAQASKRPSIKTCCVNAMRQMVKIQMMKGVKKALPLLGGVAILGLAAGLAFAFAHRR